MAADELLQSTRALRKAILDKKSAELAQLASQGQKPKMMLVSCSDSRVIPEMLLGAEPGQVFVVRNVANIVPPSGIGQSSVAAALEYAVAHLHIPHLVVCGHTDCGGIKALDAKINMLEEPGLGRWIEFARDAQKHVDRKGIEAKLRHRAIVEQNVILQLEHAAGYPPVREALKQNTLALHGWVFDLFGLKMYVYNPERGRFEAE